MTVTPETITERHLSSRAFNLHGSDAALYNGVHDLETAYVDLHAKLNTPQLHNFSEAVTLEAAHQRERWGSQHDAGKTPADWFWLIGYLAGKALNAHIAGNTEKALHHTISSAAACANWHAAINGSNTEMRPGIETRE